MRDGAGSQESRTGGAPAGPCTSFENERTAPGRLFFFGSAGRPVRLDDMLLAETSYGEGFVVPLHAHPFFCLLLEGRMVEHFERRREVLGRGCAFFHPAD